MVGTFSSGIHDGLPDGVVSLEPPDGILLGCCGIDGTRTVRVTSLGQVKEVK